MNYGLSCRMEILKGRFSFSFLHYGGCCWSANFKVADVGIFVLHGNALLTQIFQITPSFNSFSIHCDELNLKYSTFRKLHCLLHINRNSSLTRLYQRQRDSMFTSLFHVILTWMENHVCLTEISATPAHFERWSTIMLSICDLYLWGWKHCILIYWRCLAMLTCVKCIMLLILTSWLHLLQLLCTPIIAHNTFTVRRPTMLVLSKPYK